MRWIGRHSNVGENKAKAGSWFVGFCHSKEMSCDQQTAINSNKKVNVWEVIRHYSAESCWCFTSMYDVLSHFGTTLSIHCSAVSPCHNPVYNPVDEMMTNVLIKQLNVT